MEMIQKQGNWVLYELKSRDVEQYFFAYEQLLQKQNRKGFLHRIVTGDEKWVYYDNSKRRKSWGMPEYASTSTDRPNIHSAKVMLCFWWDQFGVVYYETLKPNETITGRLVSNATDAFEPSIEGEIAIVPRGTRQSYPLAWQCSATCSGTGQDILENAKMGGLTPPSVLPRRCSFRLPFVSINGIRPGSSEFPLLWKIHKIDRFINRLKRRVVFSRWYPTIAKKIERWERKTRVFCKKLFDFYFI